MAKLRDKLNTSSNPRRRVVEGWSGQVPNLSVPLENCSHVLVETRQIVRVMRRQQSELCSKSTTVQDRLVERSEPCAHNNTTHTDMLRSRPSLITSSSAPEIATHSTNARFRSKYESGKYRRFSPLKSTFSTPSFNAAHTKDITFPDAACSMTSKDSPYLPFTIFFSSPADKDLLNSCMDSNINLLVDSMRSYSVYDLSQTFDTCEASFCATNHSFSSCEIQSYVQSLMSNSILPLQGKDLKPLPKSKDTFDAIATDKKSKLLQKPINAYFPSISDATCLRTSEAIRIPHPPASIMSASAATTFTTTKTTTSTTTCRERCACHEHQAHQCDICGAATTSPSPPPPSTLTNSLDKGRRFTSSHPASCMSGARHNFPAKGARSQGWPKSASSTHSGKVSPNRSYKDFTAQIHAITLSSTETIEDRINCCSNSDLIINNNNCSIDCKETTSEDRDYKLHHNHHTDKQDVEGESHFEHLCSTCDERKSNSRPVSSSLISKLSSLSSSILSTITKRQSAVTTQADSDLKSRESSTLCQAKMTGSCTRCDTRTPTTLGAKDLSQEETQQSHTTSKHMSSSSSVSSCRWSSQCNTSSPPKHGILQIGVILTLLVSLCVSLSEAANGHTITAFEYQRKFNRPLDLGECPQRKVVVRTGNNSIVVESQRCTLHQQGTVQHMPRELNDTRNVIIESPSGIIQYLGLCGGEAASFLGILVSGDCVAVEIASRLTFNEKTLIRAYVGLYRKSLDVLDSESNITNGMVRYYKDKFYLKNRSYGTIDLIIVQFRFRNTRMKKEAEEIKLESASMSDYMKAIEEKVGLPRGVTVINLSTATSSSYEIARFKLDNWDRALRHVQIAELEIRNLRQAIIHNNLIPQPHLKYQLFPFVDTEQWSPRHTRPLSWEKISMLEVKLRHLITIAKKTARKCRGNKSNLCRRVRGLRREMNTTLIKIHDGRSKWMDLTKEDKTDIVIRYSASIETFISLTDKLTQKVRQQRRNDKWQSLNKKKNRQNRLNQIPDPVTKREGRSRRRHLIRHARRKNRNRARKNRG